MKAKERERLRTLPVVELAQELRTSRERLFRLRFKHRVTPLGNPLELRELRRKIARLETQRREKEGFASSSVIKEKHAGSAAVPK